MLMRVVFVGRGYECVGLQAYVCIWMRVCLGKCLFVYQAERICGDIIYGDIIT